MDKKLIIFIWINCVCFFSKVILIICFFSSYNTIWKKGGIIAYIVYLLFDIIYKLINLSYVYLSQSQNRLKKEMIRICMNKKIYKTPLFNKLLNENYDINLKRRVLEKYNVFEPDYRILDNIIIIIMIVLDNPIAFELVLINLVQLITDYFIKKDEQNTYRKFNISK